LHLDGPGLEMLTYAVRHHPRRRNRLRTVDSGRPRSMGAMITTLGSSRRMSRCRPAGMPIGWTSGGWGSSPVRIGCVPRRRGIRCCSSGPIGGVCGETGLAHAVSPAPVRIEAWERD
jgi:hypothetical protein